jgi:hypothetical protein
VGLAQIKSGNCEGGWGSFDWNRHPLCSAWVALKAPIVTGMNDMYKLDKQGIFKLLAGLAGMVMTPIVVNSTFYWLAYFMDYQITLMIASFLNVEFIAPEAQEPGLFRMFALYRQMTNPFEAYRWGTRLMGNNTRRRSRSHSRRSHSHSRGRVRGRSSGRSNRGSRNRSQSSTRNLVELARIRALQNMVRHERGRSSRGNRSPTPPSVSSTRRRNALNLNRNNSNDNSRRGSSRSSKRSSSKRSGRSSRR